MESEIWRLTEEHIEKAVKSRHWRDCIKEMESEIWRLTEEHIEKAVKSRHWRDCIKAHGLANACAVLEPTDENLGRVYEVERTWYGGNHPLTLTEHQVTTCKHKQLLHEYRESTKQDFEGLNEQVESVDIDSILSGETIQQTEELSRDIFNASRKCSDRFIAIAKKVIGSSVKVTSVYSQSPPPCAFAVIGLGSIARGEATPYSDLEYAFIIDSKEHAEYFHSLAIESYFQIGNVGESYLKGFHIEHLSKGTANFPPPGFRIDGITPNSGNIPTGNGLSQGRSLILTVDEFIEAYLKTMIFKASNLAPLSDLLSSSVLIYGSSGGQQLYGEFVSRVQDILTKGKSDHCAVKKRVGMIAGDVKQYTFLPKFASFGPPDNSNIKIKTDIFRYPTLLADHFRLALALESCHAWDTHQSLRELDIIANTEWRFMNLILALSIYTRTHASVSSENHCDQITLYTSSVNKASTKYFMPQNVFITLGQLLAPMKSSIKSNLQKYQSQSEFTESSQTMVQLLLKSVTASETNPLERVEILFFAGNPDKALEHLHHVAGKNCLNNGPNSILEFQRRCTKSDISKNSLVELCCYLLWAARQYSLAIPFFDWLKTNENSVYHSICWQTMIAECYNHLQQHVTANSILNEVVKKLRVSLKLKSSQSLPFTVIKELKSEQAIAKQRLLYLKATAYIYKVIGETYRFLKLYVQAEKVTRTTQKLFQDLADRHIMMEPYQIDMESNLGYISMEMGDYSTARKYFTTVLQRKKELCGPSSIHPDIATCYTNFGRLAMKLSESKEAIEYFVRAKVITCILHRGCDSHLDIAESYSNMGDAYSEVSDYTKSLECYRKSLYIVKSNSGVDHLIASTSHCIGNVYCKMKNYRVALAYLTEAVDLTTADQSFKTTLLSDIGKVYSKMGDNIKALGYSLSAMVTLNSVYNEVDVQSAMLVNFYQDMGELTDGLAKSAETMNMAKALYGDDTNHPDIAASYNNIGIVYSSMCEYSDALKYYTSSLNMMKAVYGENTNHPDIAASYSNIGIMYYRMGKCSDAMNYYTLSLNMMKAVYGDDTNHPGMATRYINIGSVYYSMGKCSDALKYYTLSLNMMKAVYGDDTNHPSIATSYNSIGNVYNIMGKYSDALLHQCLSLDMRKAVYGGDKNHPDIADSYSSIGNLCYSIGKCSDALKYHNLSLDMRKAVYGDDTNHPDIAGSYNDIGNVYYSMGEYSDALNYYTLSLDMKKAVYGGDKNHPSIATSYNSIGRVFVSLWKSTVMH